MPLCGYSASGADEPSVATTASMTGPESLDSGSSTICGLAERFQMNVVAVQGLTMGVVGLVSAIGFLEKP